MGENRKTGIVVEVKQLDQYIMLWGLMVQAEWRPGIESFYANTVLHIHRNHLQPKHFQQLQQRYDSRSYSYKGYHPINQLAQPNPCFLTIATWTGGTSAPTTSRFTIITNRNQHPVTLPHLNPQSYDDRLVSGGSQIDCNMITSSLWSL